MRSAFVSLMLMLCTMLSAQYYSTGADPWTTQWKQSIGSNYRLVYDSAFASQAQWLQPYFSNVTRSVGYSLGHTPKSVDVLFHSKVSYSNGLVSWAPKRAEVYAYPTADDDCVLWLHHVMLHEYRHAVQLDRLNRGFTRGLYYLFGEQAIGLVSGLFVPKWFLEGDAVMTETAQSQGGRGRSAAFVQEMRAAVLDLKTPRYELAYFGSYKWQLPDYYRMGYLTVSAQRHKYGAQLWSNALERTARKTWTITPFNSSLRRQTGRGKVGLYDQSMNFWREQWQRQDSAIRPTPYRVLSHKMVDYANYYMPQRHGRSIVALKNGPEEIECLVVIDEEGNEASLTIPSPKNDRDFFVGGDTLVWSERRSHVRWENGGSNVIMMLDLKTRKQKRITHHGMFAQPVVSPNGKLMAAVRTNEDMTHALVLLTFDGEVVKEYPYAIGQQISWPKFVDDNNIATVNMSVQGKSIELVNLSSGLRSVLLSPRFENIRHLWASDSALYFTSDASGIDNIYEMPLSGGEPVRMTSARFGAAWPVVGDGVLRYSNLTVNGYDVVEAQLTTRPTDMPVDPMRALADSIAQTELPMAADTMAQSVEQKDYSQWNLIRLHSWGLAEVDAQSNEVHPGLSLVSQNLLGTATAQLTMTIDDDKTDLLHAKIGYNAWFPKLALEASYGYNDLKLDAYKLEEETLAGNIYTLLHLDDRQELYKLSASMSVPLSFNSGAWLRQLTPMVQVEAHKNKGYSYTTMRLLTDGDKTWRDDPVTVRVPELNASNMSYALYAALKRRTALRDVGTRLGVSALLRYRHSPWGMELGSISSVDASLYLPSPIRHHRFLFNVMAQTKHAIAGADGVYRSFSNDIGRVRGYAAVPNKQMTVVRAGYDMPLWNADLTLGPVVHVKRLTLGLFADYGKLRTMPLDGYEKSVEQQSVGATISAETYWLRLPFGVDLGCRVAYLPSENTFSAASTFNVSFR